MKKQRISTPPVGGCSLLVIFAVLCLTVFALISLSTVQAEKRMSDAAVEAQRAYYAADREAEEIFARLRAGETVSGVQTEGNFYRYNCTISEHQKLEVTLEKEEEIWTVLRWQVTANAEPVSETLPVWDGK